MFGLLFGLISFVVICVLSILFARIAEQKVKQSLHQTLGHHSNYVRFMRDKHDLNKIGFAQQLMRRMEGFSSFGSSFSSLSVIGGAIFLIGPSVEAGGTLVIGVGWPILAFFGLMTACSVAALTSAFPTAGSCNDGVVASGRRRIGIVSGWFHFSGNILLLVLTNVLLASWLNSVAFAAFGYPAKAWVFYIGLIVLFVTQLLASGRGARWMGWFFSTAAWLQAIMTLAAVVTLSIFAWPGLYPIELLYTPESLFNNFDIGFQDHSSLLLGMLLLQRMFLGFDHAGQLAEETIDPRITVPWSIYFSVVYTFIFGTVLFTVMLLHYPVGTEVFFSYEGITSWFLKFWEIGGRAVLALVTFIIAIIGWSSGISAMTSASRTLFAMARNDAVPFARIFAVVSERSRSPQQAILFVTLLAGGIAIFSQQVGWKLTDKTTLIQWVAAIIVILHLAYVIPIGLKLVRSLKGSLKLHSGPWHLGRLGGVIDTISTAWLVLSAACVLWFIVPELLVGLGAFTVILLLYAELNHRHLLKRGPYRIVGSTRLSKKSLEELVRIERKFPQL
ncbi:amino acid permease [Paenibacillus baekrokdamisoli]|uniref:Amino acid permease n=1 Tax=Paenibacillus baekrokdamisoli TaxID=1712516 RepID=A0A3G9J583_9BACL|nr:amino acid permease [Paenibacillus baekrokdamisoli]MBB3070582.1 amino acid transporter [Paenibacillus baekrokdamisoli]BBH19933.1 amino acid permease [Paenibacillus baekrokdamisoli]